MDQMEELEVWERRCVGEVVHIRLLELLGESKLGNVARGTVWAGFDVRAPVSKSDLVEL